MVTDENKRKKPYKPQEIVDQPFPSKELAKGVRGSFFNSLTRRFLGIFKFGEKGGIQIGDYKEGVSGKLVLNIDGLYGYDTSDKLRTWIRRVGGINLYGSNTITFYPIDSEDAYGNLGVFEGVGGLAGPYLTSNFWLNLFAERAVVCGSDFEVGTFTYPAPGWVATFSVDEDTGDTYIAGDLTVDGLITGTVTHALVADELAEGGIPDYAYAAGLLIDAFDDDRGLAAYKSGANIEFVFHKDGEAPTTKTAIVPTSKGYRALHCMESPDVWFMDFCRGFKRRKWPKFWQTEWVITPSKLFMETIEPPIIVMETLLKGVVQIWGKRKGFKDKRFEKKTKEEFEKNNEFWGKAHIKKPKQKQSK